MGENDSQEGLELTENQLYGRHTADNLDMKNVLCKVLSVHWAKLPIFSRSGSVGQCYNLFIKWFQPPLHWRHIDEWTSAVRKYLGEASLWYDMTAEEIIQEIKSSPEVCRRAVDFLLRKYSSACKAYLIDIAPSSELQTYFIDRFQDPRPLAIEEVPRRPSDEDFGYVDGWPTITNLLEGDPGEQQSYCVLWIQSKPFTAEEVASRIRLFEKKAWGWGFCCFLDERETVSVRILMERMFTIQKIKALLSDADGAAADQDNEPVKVGGAADWQQGRKAVSFRHLQDCFDNAKEDRKKYFLSGSGRHGKQEEYFLPVFTTVKKEFKGVLAISTFIRNDVRDFKKDLKNRITDKENG